MILETTAKPIVISMMRVIMKTNALKLVKTFFLSVLEHGIKPCFYRICYLAKWLGKEMAELKYTKSTLAKPGRPANLFHLSNHS